LRFLNAFFCILIGMFYVYLLKSIKSGLLYTGMTTNVESRIKEHNAGKSKFTKGHIPWVLVYREGPFERLEARTREKQLKRTEEKQRVLRQH